jgi:branched-chain amino acid transport system ATP-binding protein
MELTRSVDPHDPVDPVKRIETIPILELRNITAGYGEAVIVRDVSLCLAPGRLTALVGANGAGKTTLLRTVMGQIPPREGKVIFRGEDITRRPAHARARLGLALVPEGRQLFANLSVAENLEMGAFAARERDVAAARARAFELFPRLRERLRQRAGTLSGGEQQMLAVARGLMASPQVLIFDELTLGLSPALSVDLFRALRRLKDAGQTMLLVEQNVHLSLAISDYGYVMREGRLWMEGEARTLAARAEFREAFLGM